MDPQLAAKLSNRKDAAEDEDVSENIDSRLSKKNIQNDCPSSELSSKLNRRMENVEGDGDGEAPKPFRVFNPYTEFKEFSRKDIKGLESNFKKFDQDRDGFLGFEDLKFMMEKLGVPQTHLGLKAMIKEIDEDHDNKISFREFMMLFRKAKAGEFGAANPLMELYEHYIQMESVAVDEVGVKGAKSFFQAKIEKISREQDSANEIVAEQEQKKKDEEERKRRRQEFKTKQASFQQ